MNHSQQLSAFLEQVHARLRTLAWRHYWMTLGLVAVAFTLGAIFLFLRTGFAADVVATSRWILLAVLILTTVTALWWPLKRLMLPVVVRFTEKRQPEFDGRITTWIEIENPESPMAQLLAKDALQRAANTPANLLIPSWKIRLPSMAAACCLFLLVGLFTVSPESWRYASQHLWFGWALGDAVPPQSIAIEPGDVTLKTGSNLVVTAIPKGFSPTSATLLAQLDGRWESTPLQKREDGSFGFTFYGVSRPIQYYVQAAGINSPEFTIDVMEMANVQNIQLDYRYPDWTQLEPKTETPGTRIRAVAGTEVNITITADRPMNRPEIVVNGTAYPLEGEETSGSAQFLLDKSGEYFIVDYLGDEPIRISDTYPIIEVEDTRPIVKAITPGRDRDASNIEEVTLRFEAKDDFALDQFTLFYSVNGGEWQTQPLTLDAETGRAEELLFLEELTSDDPNPDASDDASTTPNSLQPGDIIAYYAEAKDRQFSSQTDILFIDIQPFEKRFSQSQQNGGGGGGGAAGGGQENEVSQRQREILVATWNLIRTQAGQNTSSAPLDVEDNALMLSNLQNTLAEQTQTLADRARARQLDQSDTQIQEFVENLDLAIESMKPAADQLAEVELNDSLQPQQKALQHLMRADAIFRDISVSMRQPGGGGGGGGGGGAASDLAEIYELEMDLEKNQYETREPISMEEEPEQVVDESLDRLKELAERQQALADAASRSNQLSLAERWQQEQLQRELEELQERLEQLQQQQANAAAQNGQSDSSGTSSASSQAIQKALEALNEASRQNQADGNSQAAQQAMNEARQSIDEAVQQMSQERLDQVTENFDRMAQQAEALFDQQRLTESQLQEALRQSIDDRDSGRDRFSSGLTSDEEERLAEQKRMMAADLAELQKSMQQTATRAEATLPEATGTLQEAIDQLEESSAVGLLNNAAQEIESGYAPYVAVRETLTSTALNNLRFQLQQASRQAASESEETDPQAAQTAGSQSAETQLRQLRQALADAASGSSSPSQQPAQGSQAAQGSAESAGQPDPNGQRTNAGTGNPTGGTRTNGGVADPFGTEWGIPIAQNQAELDQATLQAIPGELLQLSNALREAGISDEQLAELQRRANAVANSTPGRSAEILNAEYQALLSLLESLEVSLTQKASAEQLSLLNGQKDDIRNTDEIADYFRRLSEQPKKPE